MREKLRTLPAIAIAVALATAVGATPVLAQSDVNADKVDGKDAVSSGASKTQRANKLVATNKQGLLPGNIVKPLWSLIQGIPAVLADGLVAFNEITNLPTTFSDGQIAFNELIGVPAGFADGVDDTGILAITVQEVVGASASINGLGTGTASVGCPGESKVVSGGFDSNSFLMNISASKRAGNGWLVAAYNPTANPQTITAIAYCMTSNPASAFNIAKKTKAGIRPATRNKPPASERK